MTQQITRNKLAFDSQLKVVDFLRKEHKRLNNLTAEQISAEVMSNTQIHLEKNQVKKYAAHANINIKRSGHAESGIKQHNLMLQHVQILAQSVEYLYEKLGEAMPPALQKTVDFPRSNGEHVDYDE